MPHLQCACPRPAPAAGATRRRVVGRIAGLAAGRAAQLALSSALLLGLLPGVLPGLLTGCASTPAPPPLNTGPVPRQDPGTSLPAGWQHGVFMEIFVRAYADSDGDGHGDLRGLTARLDYLQQLGVSGLWLMPITASADHDHGYAGSDFRRIEPAYGSLADFDDLLRQAHARGMGVIVDYMVNHSAAASPLFHAALDPTSPFHPWYVWQASAPAGWDIWGQNPWYPHPAGAGQGSYFATFGQAMPDFNLRHRPALDYHLDSLRFWLNRGLDGFRLDAVPHLVENSASDWNDQPQSRAMTRQLQALIKSYAGRHVVCEATAQPKDYARPGLCGSAFAFGLESQLVPAARGEAAAVQAVARYFDAAPGDPQGPHGTLGVFVSNHDLFAGRRLWDQVDGDLALYKLTAATYLLLPGTPYIYYGEEIGQAGVAGLPGDAQLRAPMGWTADAQTAGFSTGRPFRPLAPNLAGHNVASQRADPGSLLAHYQALIALRKARPSLARGNWLQAVADGATLSFQRQLGHEHTLVTYNYGRSAASLAVAGLPAGARLTALLAGAGAAGSQPVASTPPLTADAQGHARVPLPAQAFAVWQVTPSTPTPPP